MKIVLIEWEDSRQASPSWQWLEDYEPQESVICKTVGFLIPSNKNIKVVAISTSDDEQISGVVTIPTSCVLSVKELTCKKA